MIKINNVFHTIDYHTAGETARILISGFPPIKCKTMEEKTHYFSRHMDYIRTALMQEPRGHAGMMGAIITSPACDDADFGAIFMDSRGYHSMCGHVAIAIGKMMIDMGWISHLQNNLIKLDTMAGLITLTPEKVGDNMHISLRNVPSFLHSKEKVEMEGLGGLNSLHVEIAFGGNFFALVDARKLGMDLKNASIKKLVEIGTFIYKRVGAKANLRHPLHLEVKSLDVVMIYQPLSQKDVIYKNIVVFGQEEFDRSPCGTGTSALMASLYARGILSPGQLFCNESIIGSRFLGRVQEETKVGDFPAIIPIISGSAYIMGINQWIVDPHDTLKYGFNPYEAGRDMQ